MTTQYAVLPARSGRTLTAKLFTLAAPDTVAFTADSVTERTNAKGEYLCTFGEASVISGRHKLVLFYGSIAAAIGYVTFAGTDGETATETPQAAELDSAVRVKLDATQPDCNVLRTGVRYQHTQNDSGVNTVDVTIQEA